MSSGGKGGSQSTVQEIPSWIQQPSIRNMQRAEDMQQIGYMPYYGPDVAALTQPQQQAMQSNIDAASAFGLVDPGMKAMDGMPEAQDFGGISGYSSAPMFEMALSEMQRKAPDYAKRYDALYNGNSGGGRGYNLANMSGPFGNLAQYGDLQLPDDYSNVGPTPTYQDQAMYPDTEKFYADQKAQAEAAALAAAQEAAVKAAADEEERQRQIDALTPQFNGFNFGGPR
tara:strand:- start:3312 stop:3992 length:681 start_codon:yes stop_codon:yes gene_type:complete